MSKTFTSKNLLFKGALE